MFNSINTITTPCDYADLERLKPTWSLTALVDGIQFAAMTCDNDAGVVPRDRVWDYFILAAPHQSLIPCVDEVSKDMHMAAKLITYCGERMIWHDKKCDRFRASEQIWFDCHIWPHIPPEDMPPPMTAEEVVILFAGLEEA